MGKQTGEILLFNPGLAELRQLVIGRLVILVFNGTAECIEGRGGRGTTEEDDGATGNYQHGEDNCQGNPESAPALLAGLRGRGIAGYPRLPIDERRVGRRLRWWVWLLWRRRVWRIGRRCRLICLLRLYICAIIGERRRRCRNCGLIAGGISLAGSGIDGGRYLGCATYLVGECSVAYTYRITDMERTRNVLINVLLINESAVRAAKVSNRVALAIACLANFGMMGRGFRIVDHKLVIRSTPKSYYSCPKGGAACRALKRCFHWYSPTETMVTDESILILLSSK